MRTATPAVRNRPKHPREVRERMEGEVMILITGADALLRLTQDCRFPEAKARRLLNIAWEFGQKAEPYPGGYVHIWYHGIDDTNNHVFSVVEHIDPPEKRPVKRVARTAEPRYTQGTKPITRKEKEMPPRKGTRRAAPEPEVQEQNGEVDLRKYVEKDFTATMTDYIAWMDESLPGWDKLEVDRILVLGIQLYGHFQKSDFNVSRREERRAEREQARASREAEEPEEEPEPATRTRTRKPAAKPATGRTGARSATSGRAAGNGKPAAKPGARRTRAAAATPAGGDAPF